MQVTAYQLPLYSILFNARVLFTQKLQIIMVTLENKFECTNSVRRATYLNQDIRFIKRLTF